ncbi:hypothetical protein D3C76_1446310 [compost metagenome]
MPVVRYSPYAGFDSHHIVRRLGKVPRYDEGSEPQYQAISHSHIVSSSLTLSRALSHQEVHPAQKGYSLLRGLPLHHHGSSQ